MVSEPKVLYTGRCGDSNLGRNVFIVSKMAEKFHIPMFDRKMNFMVCKSTIENLLVQSNLDEALKEAKPSAMSDSD